MFSSIAGLGLVGDLKFRLILWDCVVDVLTCWVFLSLTGKEEVCVGSFFLGAEKTMRNSNCSNTSVKFTRDHLTKPFHHWMYFLSYIKIAYNGICYLFLLYKFYARKKKKHIALIILGIQLFCWVKPFVYTSWSPITWLLKPVHW